MFSGFFAEYKVFYLFERQILKDYQYFLCTLTFDQFNASILNKNITFKSKKYKSNNFFPKNDPIFLNTGIHNITE